MERKLELRALVSSLATQLGVSKDARGAPGQRFARWLLAIIIMANIIAGSSLWLFGAHRVSAHASSDLTARISAIQTLIQGGDLLDTTHLSLLQSQIAGAEADLTTLESTFPFNGLIGTPNEGMLNTSMVAAADFLAAAEDLVQASEIVQPSLTGLLVSAVGASPKQVGNGMLPSQSVDNALAAVRTDVNNAQASWQAAETQLQALGNSSAESTLGINAANINTITQYLRNNSSQLATVFTTTTGVLEALPAMLGVSQPDHFLLLYLDPNQLLPTGGQATSYAVVEVAGGAVISGIHFQSALTLDCAHGCSKAGVSQLDPSPDFVTRANDAETAFLSEAGDHIHVVMGITPDLIGDILAILGPVVVPGLGVTIGPGNVRQENTSYDERVVTSAELSGNTRPDTSGFAINLMSAVTKALAGASHDQLLRVGAALMQALSTKHLLIFTNYYSIEQQLTALNIGGRVASTTSRDTLFITDTDLDEEFNGSAIAETITDHVTLSGNGTATHALSITYRYAYPAPGTVTSLPTPYHDLVEAIVSESASKVTTSGLCGATAPIALAYHHVLACKVTVNPGQTVTVHLSWMVSVPQAGESLHHYQLLLQRQVNAQVAVTVTIAAAPGLSLTPDPPGEHSVQGQVEWTTSLLAKDSAVGADYRRSG